MIVRTHLKRYSQFTKPGCPKYEKKKKKLQIKVKNNLRTWFATKRAETFSKCLEEMSWNYFKKTL